jgi:hypothetical protein
MADPVRKAHSWHEHCTGRLEAQRRDVVEIVPEALLDSSIRGYLRTSNDHTARAQVRALRKLHNFIKVRWPVRDGIVPHLVC